MQFRNFGDRRTELRKVKHGYTTVEHRDLSRAGLEQCFDKTERSLAGGRAG